MKRLIMSELPAHSPTVVAGSNVAVARGVTLGYGDHVAIRASDFVIPTGKITAVIGPNGSGKSTILNAIAGLLVPKSGTITTFGKEPQDVRSRVSYVLQYTPVTQGTPITVGEVVAMGRYPITGLFGRMTRSDRDRVSEAMRELAITDLAGRHLGELSGGQRQRVYVAQGIAQEHDLLLLDEPLTGLDLVSAQAIDRIIHAEPERGCSVVLTTHDLEEAKAADHVLLVAGHVIAQGAPEQVLTMDNLREAYGLGALHDEDVATPNFPTEHHHDH
jgi:manganese transport system ATP-binding protein